MNAHTILRRYGTIEITNQDLVTGPHYIHIYSDTRHISLQPKLFKPSTQTQNFNDRRNIGHDSKVRVHSTSLVTNDVFTKRSHVHGVVNVSHDQSRPHDFLPLSLYFCRTHGIPLIIQQFPAGRLQPQTLVASKMLATLEMLQNSVVTMCQNNDVFTMNTAIKMAGLCRSICGATNKKLTKIACPAHLLHPINPFGSHSSPGLTHVLFIAVCVSGVTQSKNNTSWSLLHLLQLAQNII